MADVYSDINPEKIAGREILKSLGTGVMGQNFLAKDGTFTHVVKVINHDIVKRMSETGKLKGDKQHPNVLTINEYVVDEVYDEVYFIDYLSEMERSNYLFFKEEGVQATFKAFRQIADGFKFVHNEGVAHLNFKPSNLLVKKRKKGIFPIVTDFGFHLKYDSSCIDGKALAGMAGYMAPEMLAAFEASKEKDIDFYKKCDLYSFGVCFAEAVCGRQLFTRGASIKAAQEEKQDLAVRMIAVNSPNKCVDIKALDQLVNGCLALDPKKRHNSFSEVVEMMDSCINDDSDDSEE